LDMSKTDPPACGTRSSASEMIVSGHVSSAVWSVAWPTVINTLILNAYTLINTWFLGQLPNSGDPLAASGVGGQIMMIQFSLLIGLAAGTGALVSQFLGARRNDDAIGATRQSMLLSVVVASISAIPLIVYARPLMRMICDKPAIVPLAADYTAIISCFSIATFLYMIIVTALRSAGDVKSALYAGASVTVVNIVLDWFLILGHGPFPVMGIRGAAWATGISRIIGVLITIWFLKRSVLGESFSHFKHHDGYTRQLLKIGWPAMLTNMLWSIAAALYVKVIAILPGSDAVAAYTVAMRLECLAFMPGLAYSQAATPLVGQNLGAGKPDRAAHCAWIATLHAVAIMSFFALVFLVFPQQLAHPFAKNASPAVMPAIVLYLRINAISEPFLALNMVLRGALQGAGDTLMPALFTLISFYIVRLPLALLLSVHLGYGVTGAWIAMASSTILSGVLMAVWFQMGHWRRRSLVGAD